MNDEQIIAPKPPSPPDHSTPTQEDYPVENEKLAMKTLPNPTEADLASPLFNAIWEVTKTWDVNIPEYYEGYCEMTGSHVMLILAAISAAGFVVVPMEMTSAHKAMIAAAKESSTT